MRSIRAFFITLAGLTFVGIITVFTASIGIALAGVATVLLFGQWLSSVLANQERRPQPARAYSRAEQRAKEQRDREMHVWNDGKGTIIDM
jgi:hypothetical protein